MAMNDSIVELFANIRPLKIFDFYKTRSLAPQQKTWMKVICDTYATSSEGDRKRIEEQVSQNISFLFLMYAHLMAVDAVREKSEQRIVDGLTSISISHRVNDWRDALSPISLLFHSAIKIRSDPSLLFRRAAESCREDAAKFFQHFLTRTPENMDIAKFGWKEGANSDGEFVYVSLSPG